MIIPSFSIYTPVLVGLFSRLVGVNRPSGSWYAATTRIRYISENKHTACEVAKILEVIFTNKYLDRRKSNDTKLKLSPLCEFSV